jgi:hypothetical protein
MLIKNQKLRLKLSVILPALVFIIASYDPIVDTEDYGFGFFYLLVGICNLILLRYIEKQTLLSNTIINGLNMLASFVVGVQFYYGGKMYIPYAYFIIGLLYLFITIRFVLKYRRTLKTKP